MRNLIFISFLFLILGCGYTSVYKNSDNKDFHIIITEMKGDMEINNLIKNQVSLYSNKNSANKLNVSIKTNSEKKILSKNSAGVITNYNLIVNSIFTINVADNSSVLNFNESINIKNQTNNFERNLYEKNIKRNFASSIREKFISAIINLK